MRSISVSLVIASRNEGSRLEKTVASCLGAVEAMGGEIIVADDASTDGAADAVKRRFASVRVVTQSGRQGVAPTRNAGARVAAGRILIFLDGHCLPEEGALERLVEVVERFEGRALATPRVAVLDEGPWRNRLEDGVGHGFTLDLETLDRRWVALSHMKPVDPSPMGFPLYESPGLAGCAFAVDRRLFDALGGFDEGMRMWGVEDLDFGLRAWMAGIPIAHDPSVVVGHRFREVSEDFDAPEEHIFANQLRMARRVFEEPTWLDWLERFRERVATEVAAQSWTLFSRRRADLERDRESWLAARSRDEFTFAERFGLWWPRWLQGKTLERGWGEEPPQSSAELYLRHAQSPRGRGATADADIVESSPAGCFTLFLKLERARSGVVYIRRATFEADASETAMACGSWLTHRIEGGALSEARTLKLEAILNAFGPVDGLTETSMMVAGVLRRALERI